MFVVSIFHEGHERNLVATGIRMKDGLVVVQAGGRRHVFPSANLIEIVMIEEDVEDDHLITSPNLLIN
ncbi:hypothetical protein WGT02_22650 (plasmid) [Rhizobium sp. T1470]|uniref:hypothetical protein n=1 Tax=unclassified Rhizobium TaxID=2613769 RepID=UPI001AAFFC25|nr:hypothetical protein [Rhizobium sp. T1473]MCA0804635.1 hypothetical protein [Rhizobium sp. T1473]